MNFSNLSQNDRIALIAGAVVAIGALISISYDWGLIMIESLLAGLVAVIVLLAPGTVGRLPTSRGTSLLIAGVVASATNVLVALDSINWITNHLASFDALQFLAGLVAALVLLWTGWVASRAEGGSMGSTMGSSGAGMAPPAS
jgi:hypothetical protein